MATENAIQLGIADADIRVSAWENLTASAVFTEGTPGTDAAPELERPTPEDRRAEYEEIFRKHEGLLFLAFDSKSNPSASFVIGNEILLATSAESDPADTPLRDGQVFNLAELNA